VYNFFIWKKSTTLGHLNIIKRGCRRLPSPPNVSTKGIWKNCLFGSSWRCAQNSIIGISAGCWWYYLGPTLTVNENPIVQNEPKA